MYSIILRKNLRSQTVTLAFRIVLGHLTDAESTGVFLDAFRKKGADRLRGRRTSARTQSENRLLGARSLVRWSGCEVPRDGLLQHWRPDRISVIVSVAG